MYILYYISNVHVYNTIQICVLNGLLDSPHGIHPTSRRWNPWKPSWKRRRPRDTPPGVAGGSRANLGVISGFVWADMLDVY